MTKNKTNLLLIIAVLLIGAIGISFAVTVYESYTINKITTSFTIKNQIVEEYTKRDNVYPGDTIDKKVNVKNTGNVDSLVRVKVTKVWGTGRDGSGNIIVDSSLDTSNIKINYNRTYWIDGNDGYFYYMGILKSGETTKEALFNTFTVDEDSSNNYQGKTADIVVSMESIQAAGNAIATMWNKTYEFLDVSAPSANVDLGKTTVTFLNPTDKFSIETNKIDLFKNFKDLLPGTGRSQTITVTNSDTKTREIYLRAENTTQDTANADKIDKLLKEYVTITIKEGSTIIYNGPIYGSYDVTPSGTNSMKNNISLGSFATNVSKDLVVTLNVDPTMGNDYQNLLGNIKWVFGVEETEGSLLVHHYLENTAIKLSPNQESVGNIGSAYTTSAASLGNYYELVATPSNATGNYADGQTVVTYYYKLKKAKFEEDPTITKTATDKVTSSSAKITNTISYSAKISFYKGNGTLTVVDTLPQTIDVANSDLAGGTYDATTKTITWTESLTGIDTYTNGEYSISFSKTVTLKYTSLDYINKEMTNTVKGTLTLPATNETKEVDDEATTEIDVKGKVIAQYFIKDTTTKLAADVETTDNVGEDYETNAKDFYLYTLVEDPTNKTGTYTEDDIYVKYYYTLNDPEYDDNTTKEATDIIMSKDDKITYTISYSNKINYYNGTGALTVTDKLPYEIDEANSDIAGGTYDAVNKTITWNETYNIASTTSIYEIAFTKVIVLKYKDVDYTKEIKNEVTSELITDETKTTTDESITKTEIPSKVIVNHYINNTDIKVDDSQIIDGKFGDDYITEASTKAIIDGYHLITVVGVSRGIMDEDVIVVNYYYEKNPKNPNTGDSIIKYAMSMLCSVALFGISGYYIIRSRKKEKFSI